MKFRSFLVLMVVFSSCKAQNNLETMIIKYGAVTRGSAIEIEASTAQLIYKGVDKVK